MAEDKVLSAKEVAAVLGVCEMTIYRWVAAGKLKPMRIGRILRFRHSQLLIAMERFEEQSENRDTHRPEWS
jgi:excisionase family DNA binding protein